MNRPTCNAVCDVRLGPAKGAATVLRAAAMPSRMVLWALLATAVAAPTAALGQASFQGLGDLPGGSFYSIAADVSADGRVVVGASWSSVGLEAFHWTEADGMVGLGGLGGQNEQFVSSAAGVSDDGTVVVGTAIRPSGWTEAFRWTAATREMVGLGHLPDGAYSSDAFGVSADGAVIVGWSENGSSSEAYRWTEAEGMVGLGDLPGDVFASVAYAVGADGTLIAGVGTNADIEEEAFAWTDPGGMAGLGFLPGLLHGSVAYGISADASAIVGFSFSGSSGQKEGFRWRAGEGMVGLGVLPGGRYDTSVANDVSADGSTVVGKSWSGTHDDWEAFIWDNLHGIRSLQDLLVNDYGLDLSDWILREATGISADGLTMVGFGYAPYGAEAWIARLPPGLAGDLNGDGCVDQADLGILLGDWECTGGDCPGDADGDGDTDQSDLGVILSHWEEGCP